MTDALVLANEDKFHAVNALDVMKKMRPGMLTRKPRSAHYRTQFGYLGVQCDMSHLTSRKSDLKVCVQNLQCPR